MLIQSPVAFSLSLLVFNLMMPIDGLIDLNRLPTLDDESTETAPLKVATSGNYASSKITYEQAKKLKSIYAKVLKLFDVLKMCDDEDFDIERIAIPSSFTEQEKAMMVLAKVAKTGMIKKSDATRYKRIMENCGKISNKYQEREAEKLSIESQVSGIFLSDVQELRRKLEESPIDNLRKRFSESPRDQLESIRFEAVHEGARAAKIPKVSGRQTTTTPALNLDVPMISIGASPSYSPQLFNFI